MAPWWLAGELVALLLQGTKNFTSTYKWKQRSLPPSLSLSLSLPRPRLGLGFSDSGYVCSDLSAMGK